MRTVLESLIFLQPTYVLSPCFIVHTYMKVASFAFKINAPIIVITRLSILVIVYHKHDFLSDFHFPNWDHCDPLFGPPINGGNFECSQCGGGVTLGTTAM